MNILKLFRPAVTLMVGLSTLAGGIYHSFPMDIRLLWAVLACVLLSAGCSALNQYQEIEQDSLMERTKKRPLPKSIISPEKVLSLSIVLISVSFLIMFLFTNKVVLVSGIIVVITYNFMYTPLKKVTSLALLVGSFSGAAPFFIGWAASGGDPFDIRVLTFTGIFYLWQIPHFIFLARKYRHEYENAGFKTQYFPIGNRRGNISASWITGYSTLIIFASVINAFTVDGIKVFTGIIAVLSATYLIFKNEHYSAKFHIINLSVLLIAMSAAANSIILHFTNNNICLILIK